MELKDMGGLKQEIRGHRNALLLLAAVVALNVALTFAPLEGGVRIAAHVCLAALSGGLVLTFFMHLRREKPLTLAVLALTFFLLIAMLFLTWAARHDLPALTEYHPAATSAVSPHVP